MSDDKEIRELMDREFEAVERKLSNGSGADPATQGQALALLLKHVRILVKRNTVTEKECEERRAACPGSKPVVVSAPSIQDTVGVAVAKLTKDVSPWIILFVYLVGKGRGWW